MEEARMSQELETRYEKMWEENVWNLGQVEVDSFLRSQTDRRTGITLRIRPSAEVLRKVVAFQRLLMKVAPEQYHYPEESIHVTGLSIVSCSAEYERFDSGLLAQYVDLIDRAIQGVDTFEIAFQGVTLGSVGVLIQGHPDAGLAALRESVRSTIQEAGVFQTLDVRYKIDSAHSTIMRYRQEIQQVEELRELLTTHRALEFGQSSVTHLELVVNDWYHSPAKTDVIYSFQLD
ncbi:hypothetical protein BFP72_00290 [Reichenbachiella sp. 5M10]|uniref:2'-5' RNA ligase family protein n=1 Tax=Reichenbachiella sp. 5M10 TaxID=1889772 RepID=UPI000C158E89|nr:hypothetical protein [Reichenbachiella sp. 5M10]PIB33978.1 hypothetical protein BFP72_00290 [Reichenbachiella sp. 5M10]